LCFGVFSFLGPFSFTVLDPTLVYYLDIAMLIQIKPPVYRKKQPNKSSQTRQQPN